MGMRSTLTTDHYNIVWPKWLRDKYSWLRLPLGCNGPLTTYKEIKQPPSGDEFYKDIQKVLKDHDWGDKIPFSLVWLNEDSSIDIVVIYASYITYLVTDHFEV